MPTDSGLKDLSYQTVDGGTAAPTFSTTTTPPSSAGSVVIGSTIDLLGIGSELLPPEIAIRAAMSHTKAGTPTAAFSGIPRLEVYAQWLTGASAGTPVVGDRQSDLAVVAASTIAASATFNGTSPYRMAPLNARVIATKGRYLRLAYATTEVPGDAVKFGAKIAPIFSRTADAE